MNVIVPVSTHFDGTKKYRKSTGRPKRNPEAEFLFPIARKPARYWHNYSRLIAATHIKIIMIG